MSTLRKIYLASASPRRKEILSAAGIEFTIVPADIDESVFMGLEPGQAVMCTARAKATAAAQGISESALVIGSDTLVYAEKNLGKPASILEAEEMLASLAGRTHSVYTGICVYDTVDKRNLTRYRETKVDVSPMSEEEIRRYVASGEPMDKAGAYAVQGLFAKYIDRIDGCYFNVMGLPIADLRKLLLEFDVKI